VADLRPRAIILEHQKDFIFGIAFDEEPQIRFYLNGVGPAGKGVHFEYIIEGMQNLKAFIAMLEEFIPAVKHFEDRNI
jgi:hypothetical protein